MLAFISRLRRTKRSRPNRANFGDQISRPPPPLSTHLSEAGQTIEANDNRVAQDGNKDKEMNRNLMRHASATARRDKAIKTIEKMAEEKGAESSRTIQGKA